MLIDATVYTFLISIWLEIEKAPSYWVHRNWLQTFTLKRYLMGNLYLFESNTEGDIGFETV